MLQLAHGHYTVDVIIAYFVTTRIFWTYHTLANNASLKVSRITLSILIIRKVLYALLLDLTESGISFERAEREVSKN